MKSKIGSISNDKSNVIIGRVISHKFTSGIESVLPPSKPITDRFGRKKGQEVCLLIKTHIQIKECISLHFGQFCFKSGCHHAMIFIAFEEKGSGLKERVLTTTAESRKQSTHDICKITPKIHQGADRKHSCSGPGHLLTILVHRHKQRKSFLHSCLKSVSQSVSVYY